MRGQPLFEKKTIFGRCLLNAFSNYLPEAHLIPPIKKVGTRLKCPPLSLYGLSPNPRGFA